MSNQLMDRIAAVLLIPASVVLAENVNVVNVEGPRALSTLARDELIPHYGLAVTYEEGPYVGPELLRVQQANGVYPKAKAVEFRLPPRAPRAATPGTASLSDTPPAESAAAEPPGRDLLEAVVEQYNSSGNPGAFNVVYSYGYAHIIPTGRWGNARMQDFEPVLSTPVSIHAEAGSCAEVLRTFFAQVARNRGVKIEEGTVPINALLQPRPCAVGGDHVAARDVLIQLLAQLGSDNRFPGWPTTRFTWALHYDPNTDAYYLNIRSMPQLDHAEEENKAATPPPPNRLPDSGAPAGKLATKNKP